MKEEEPLAFAQFINGLGPILFESIKIPFGIFNKNHKVLWANDALASLHQILPEKLIGNVCHEIVHNSPEPCKGCPIPDVIRTGRLQIAEKWYEFPGRPRVWGEVHYYPVRGSKGDIEAVIVLGFDVTDKNNRIDVLNNYSKYLSDKLNYLNDPNQEIRLDDGEVRISVKLSDRENEILRLMAEGYTNVQISFLLSISANTVKTHINSIFNKMGVNDRTHAAVCAIRNNLI